MCKPAANSIGSNNVAITTGTPADVIDPSITVRPVRPTATGFYGNARGFKQASGEFWQQILDCDADVWAILKLM